MTTHPLTPGDIIHGFANGVFGRDHYDCVRIEAVGPDWIVAREAREDFGPDPSLSFASGRRELQLCQQARDEPRHDEGRDCPFADDGPPLTTWKRPA